MCWGLAPPVVHVGGYPQDVPVEPVISRELLRAVCEPFFEQMLTALQQALQQTQKRQSNEEAQTLRAMTQTTKYTSLPLQSVVRPSSRTFCPLDPMLDEETTEADELGAFASLLSGPSSEGESIDAVGAKSPENEVLAPVPPSPASCEDSERTSDPEKTTMVCRHWKSKGWCRLESNCKFLHPEHKRGVGAAKACSGSANGGDISRADRPGMSTVLSLSDAISAEVDVPTITATRRRKKGGKDGPNNLQKVQLGDPKQGAAAPQPLGHFGEHQILCSP